jgi:hypothetical protein
MGARVLLVLAATVALVGSAAWCMACPLKTATYTAPVTYATPAAVVAPAVVVPLYTVSYLPQPAATPDTSALSKELQALRAEIAALRGNQTAPPAQAEALKSSIVAAKCASCHKAGSERADLTHADAAMRLDAVRRVMAGTMPPKSAPKLEGEDVSRVIAELSTTK